MFTDDELSIPYGFKLNDDGTMVTEIIFDGQIVWYRDPNGEVMEMAALCYLDLVMRRATVMTIAADNESCIHPAGITPGIVVCAMLDYLHSQWHSDLDALLAGSGMSALGAFRVTGPDDLKALFEGKVEASEAIEPSPTSTVIQGDFSGKNTKH